MRGEQFGAVDVWVAEETQSEVLPVEVVESEVWPVEAIELWTVVQFGP